MNWLLERIGRRRLLGGGLVAGSAALLVVSVFVIVTSLQGEDADLPSEGSLSQILDDDSSDGSYSFRVVPLEESGSRQSHGPVPVQLAIPRLFVSADVIKLGLDAENIPQVPDSAGQVAWYDFSATPGRDDNTVFSGHVDWQTSSGAPIPGVFYRLRELRIGDDIDVTLEDGEVMKYRVTGNVATDYEDPNVVRAMEPTLDDVITLITCGGSWINDSSRSFGGVYSHRIVVRAELVTPAAAADLSES